MHSECRRKVYRRTRCLVAVTVMIALAAILMAGSVLAESDDAAKFGCYCVGTVGNVNCDYRDDITLGDVSLLIDHLYISGVRLPNLQEANIDGDPDGVISIGDVSLLIDHLFITGPSLVLPDCPSPYNTPPSTQIADCVYGVPYGVPAINSVAPAESPSTGVRMRWYAYDLVDHPYDFLDYEYEYEYRMYGPYSDSLFDIVTDTFIVPVFLHNDGRVMRFDQEPPEFYEVCDTTWEPGGTPVISCDTVMIDELESSNEYGAFDTLFDFENPDFESNPSLNQLAVISGDGGDPWITPTGDTVYNVYADYSSDTTLRMNFFFTVRAREILAPDVIDPTPAFVPVIVIDPKHERDILVMNWQSMANENRAVWDSEVVFWDQAISSWASSSGLDEVIHFDYERDIIRDYDQYGQNNRMLDLALKYKAMINIQDAATAGGWSSQGQGVQNVMVAMENGVHVWTAARVPLSHHSFTSPADTTAASALCAYFFGLERYYFPGWGGGLVNPNDGYGYALPRVEDFVGAASQLSGVWPELAIDTGALNWRYVWQGCIPEQGQNPVQCFPFYPFLPEPGALPQVGYCDVTEDAEVLYRYISCYSEGEHPFDSTRYYHGQPVMHRVERELFRSVHSVFTPLALEETTGQQMVDSVLTWLYERWLPVHTSDKPTDIVGAPNEGGAK